MINSKKISCAFWFLMMCPAFLFSQVPLPNEEGMLLQAKLMVTRRDIGPNELNYTYRILEKIENKSLESEVSFYKALILIKTESMNYPLIVDLLEGSVEKGHPLAIALLYKINFDPFLLEEKNINESKALKTMYENLYRKKEVSADFNTALSAVNKMIAK